MRSSFGGAALLVLALIAAGAESCAQGVDAGPPQGGGSLAATGAAGTLPIGPTTSVGASGSGPSGSGGSGSSTGPTGGAPVTMGSGGTTGPTGGGAGVSTNGGAAGSAGAFDAGSAGGAGQGGIGGGIGKGGAGGGAGSTAGMGGSAGRGGMSGSAGAAGSTGVGGGGNGGSGGAGTGGGGASGGGASGTGGGAGSGGVDAGIADAASDRRVAAHPVCAVGACKLVFVSSTSVAANAGSAVAFDATCQSLADGRNFSGTWKAWVSDAASSPSSRFAHATVPYRLLDGTVVANNWNDLTDGSLAHAIDVFDDASRASASLQVWTGTTSAGSVASETCTNWTQASMSLIADFGLTDRTDDGWSDWQLQYCNAPGMHLYCFEQ